MTKPVFDKAQPLIDPEVAQRDLDRVLGAQTRQLVNMQVALDVAYDEIERLQKLVPPDGDDDPSGGLAAVA